MALEAAEKLYEAYIEMAKQARYRPSAPSDGHGHIQLTKTELSDPYRLDMEAVAYVKEFRAEEDGGRFVIGCSEFSTNKAFMWTIEAARCLAGCANETAMKLLKMAMDEIATNGRSEPR